jgi:ATP-dependent RNA helicase DeaD
MNTYVKVIDLTSSSASKSAKSERFKEPDPPLPEVTLEALPPSLREAADRLGWSSLMPVQSKAIPYILEGRDLIVQSRTGSGKTGAFLLPLFEKLDPNLKGAQALILTPTRELARQIFDTFAAAIPEDSSLRAISVYGGVGYGAQIKAFKEGAQVVVGTPGRILDHLYRKTLKLHDLKVLILDEADEMLSVGFWPAMKDLKRFLPRERESHMFSATIPYKVEAVGDEFLRKPGLLSLGRISVDKMTHRYTVTAPMDKNRSLVRFIELENPDSAIIFANTKKRVEYLSLYLQQYGFEAQGLSGDLSQKERDRVMKKIRAGSIRFLVATDVAARGIDISGVSHIWMYDVPLDPEYYVHRAGRTARAGETGEVIALATVTDEHVLKSISKKFNITMQKVEEPEDEEVESHVCTRVIELLEARLRGESDTERTLSASFVPVVQALMDDDHVHWLSMLFDGFYHQSLHAVEPHTGRSEPVSPPPMVELIDRLDRRFQDLSNLGRERLLRFVPLVTQLIDEGEPELPAILLADFCANVAGEDSSRRSGTRPKSRGQRKQSRKRH